MSDNHLLSAVRPSEARQIVQACDRFEAAWKAGRRPDIKQSLGIAEGPVRSALLRQLLILDCDYRRRAGDDPRADDYQTRFPEDTGLIEDATREMTESLQSTGMGSDVFDARRTPRLGGTASDISPGFVSGKEPGMAQYDLLHEVGHGGIGVVFRGRDRLLGRELAVKVLRDDYRDRPDACRRFDNEARVGSQLQHPAIVPVYASGRFADGRPYFTMKLVEGRTLAALLQDRANSGDDLPRWLGILGQVCQAMAYAHLRGVIHRDLKPANVMVGAFGEVQVMDWGFAKVLGGDKRVMQETCAPVARAANELKEASQSGTMMGTPAYMPPEQARGDSALIDSRTDVFALGAMLCEILTGKPPYTGRSTEEITTRAAAADLADAHARLDRCGVDPVLRDLAKRCLAADRCARPANAAVVARDLTDFQATAQERLRQAQLEQSAAEARAQEAGAKQAAERRALRLALVLRHTAVLG